MRGVRVDEGPVHPDDPLPGAESGSVADTPSIHGSNEVTAILLRVEIEAEFFGRCRLFLEFREIRSQIEEEKLTRTQIMGRGWSISSWGGGGAMKTGSAG